MYGSLNSSSDSSDNNNNESLIEDILIPYCGKLPQDLFVGSFIEIFAKIDENAERIAVNLITGSDDIAFHFNARLEEGSVVRNSRINDEWAYEEREPLKMPFEKNQSFTLIISVAEEAFRVFINGIHFIDFKHRVPYSGVTSVAIEGELKVLWIKCDRMVSDNNWDALVGQPQTFFDPKLPFVEDIKDGLRVGMVLSIIGRPLSNDSKFEINLIQKQDSVRVPNITLHMSVRFGKTSEQSLVVRNHRFDGQWGTEDRYCTAFPFAAEKIFDMRLIVENNRFIIIINGKNFTEFPIRLYPLINTNQIEISGNLRLLSVRF